MTLGSAWWISIYANPPPPISCLMASCAVIGAHRTHAGLLSGPVKVCSHWAKVPQLWVTQEFRHWGKASSNLCCGLSGVPVPQAVQQPGHRLLVEAATGFTGEAEFSDVLPSWTVQGAKWSSSFQPHVCEPVENKSQVYSLICLTLLRFAFSSQVGNGTECPIPQMIVKKMCRPACFIFRALFYLEEKKAFQLLRKEKWGNFPPACPGRIDTGLFSHFELHRPKVLDHCFQK